MMYVLVFCTVCFFFKQKTAYELRISDWSSDVCSSDLAANWWSGCRRDPDWPTRGKSRRPAPWRTCPSGFCALSGFRCPQASGGRRHGALWRRQASRLLWERLQPRALRSEEHTSELQSLMRISYAVFCLKKKKKITNSQSEEMRIHIGRHHAYAKGADQQALMEQ